jgi:hypothetical protein
MPITRTIRAILFMWPLYLALLMLFIFCLAMGVVMIQIGLR